MIEAQDDVATAPVDSTVGDTSVLNVLEDNGSDEDTVNGTPATVATVTIAASITNPPAAGITIATDGTVAVAAGTPRGTYMFDYTICETARPTNCDTATVTLVVQEPAIGVVKSSTFNDESGDGNAQVGETITFEYTVTNLGDFELSSVTLTETGFGGAGVTPTPVLSSGDNGDNVLQTTETWIYRATYSLVQADLDAANVENAATVHGTAPSGTVVSDVSDSANPTDGNGTGTPGSVGPDDDEPTNTPLTSAPIVANDDVRTDPIDATTAVLGVVDVFDNNGSGVDTLNGSATSASAVTVSADPGNPVPAGLTLNPDGTVDVAAGTAPGTYTFGYIICEIGNVNNCDPATVTVTVGEGDIGLVKSAVFNDELTADGNGQVGETITYTYTVTNIGDFALSDIAITETGFTGNGAVPVVSYTSGDANGDTILQTTETWIFNATYSLLVTDISDGNVDNQANVRGTTPGGTVVNDDSDSDLTTAGNGTDPGVPGSAAPNDDDPTRITLTTAPIVASDDVLVPPVDAAVDQDDVLNVFSDNGSGDDTLNGAPTNSSGAMVEVVVTDPPPSGITLNPDGSVDVAMGTTPGTYTFSYEICEVLNPSNCDDAEVTLTVGEGQIAVVKSAVFNDEGFGGVGIGDGNGQVGETITYTYNVTNPGDFDLSNVTLTETTFTGADTLNPPVPMIQTNGNGNAILEVGETWVYTATYTLVAGDLTVTPPATDPAPITNQATAAGETPAGGPVSDLSDSTRNGDGDGVGRPDSGPGNDDPLTTVFATSTIAANDDIIEEPFDANVALDNVLNIFTATGPGDPDDLNGALPVSGGGAPTVLVTIDPSNPLPAGLTLDADGNLDIAAGTAPGSYEFGYTICEIGNPTNCDPAIVQVTIGEPMIGILKQSQFNDESADGFAQVGETITYTYTVSNEGNLDLSSPSVIEENANFTGDGTLPVPVLVNDGDGDAVLSVDETWFYQATYTLVAADLDAGQVDNLATASGTSPNGQSVTDMSDSQNPGDGNGTATPGDGAGNDDPTVTPLLSAPIEALNDLVEGINGFTGAQNVMDVLLDNGSTPDTVGGTPTNIGIVAISVVTAATPIGSAPVPVLDPATGMIDVPAGTPAGTYNITYEICELLNPSSCDEAIATVVVEEPVIDAVDNDFTALILDGEDGDMTPSVFTNDTLDGAPFIPVNVVGSIVDEGGLTGVTINPDGTLNVPAGTPAGTYPVTYRICDALNPTNCDDAIATINIGTIQAIPETFAVVNGNNGGITESILTSDTLSGVVITDPSDVVLTIDSIPTGFVLDPATNGIIVPPGTPEGSYPVTYTICDATNPAICSSTTETVVVGSILAIAETFPAISENGGTTSITVLDSDLLNGVPVSLDTVSLIYISGDPEVTLNPDGTLTLAEGAPAGFYDVFYEICDLANPTICSRITETIEMGVIAEIETIKTYTITDNGDGVNGVGDTINYVITVTNSGNADLDDVAIVDTLTDANGNALTLDAQPVFVSATMGSTEGNLLIGEMATYATDFTMDAEAVASGEIVNSVMADALPILPVGSTETNISRVSDMSDEGNPANGEDDPTVLALLPLNFVDGLTITKTANVSTVLRGGIVPYTIVIDNQNPGVAIAAVAVDSLPSGFVFVEGSATLNGAAVTPTVTAGRIIEFGRQLLPPMGVITVTLSARVLTGVEPGEHVNKADVLDERTRIPLAPTATATVRIEPEPVFDCGDVIGKVYDDLNHNGYQDEGEPGLPAARIAGVDGTIITTDDHGRYHVPCAALPENRGTNFILKLDERSLPTGYRLTTENPRVIRLTRGKLSELNFGASITQIVRVDINSRAFMLDDAGKLQMVPKLEQGLETLLNRIKPEPSQLRIAFHLGDSPTDAQKKTAKSMVRDLRRHIQKRWRRIGDYKLNIETTFVRGK